MLFKRLKQAINASVCPHWQLRRNVTLRHEWFTSFTRSILGEASRSN
jgi:hypothetical protein